MYREARRWILSGPKVFSCDPLPRVAVEILQTRLVIMPSDDEGVVDVQVPWAVFPSVGFLCPGCGRKVCNQCENGGTRHGRGVLFLTPLNPVPLSAAPSTLLLLRLMLSTHGSPPMAFHP